MITLALAIGAFLLLLVNIAAIRKAGEMQARLEREEQDRLRDQRMAAEMLKERSREDVARDLDEGNF